MTTYGGIFMEMTVSIAEIKSRLSDYIARSVHRHERIIITKRNRPVAALVSIDDLRKLEQSEERQGLAGVVGKWQGFEEITESLKDISSIRKKGGSGRNVSL
jgi:prevent-host-death family protein